METSSFIVAAYAITGIVLAVLCLATWRRARRTNTQLKHQNHHES
jgi:heme exporter protein CcmD